ncbi:MAG: hypothetical protein J6X43_03735 [Bacteroidales bacterium]|nr:hypothetical protein [Bacteroidales bacterium]
MLPIVLILLWGTNLLHPQFVSHYYDTNPMVLYKPLMAIQNWNALAGQIVSLVILLINVIIIIKVNSITRLIENKSMFFIFLFIFLSASLQDYKQLNPMQPALTFLIIGVQLLFNMYKNEHELKKIFEAGFCFAIASLFYAPAIYFAILIFIGLGMFVPFYWRQWLSALVGLLLPFILVLSIAFCFDGFTHQVATLYENITVENSLQFTKLFPIAFSLFLALLFLRSVFYVYLGGTRKVSTRKYYTLLLLFLVLVLVLYLFVPYVTYDFLFFGGITVSVFIANFMVNMRSKFWQEVLFIIIIAFTVLVQIFPETEWTSL